MLQILFYEIGIECFRGFALRYERLLNISDF